MTGGKQVLGKSYLPNKLLIYLIHNLLYYFVLLNDFLSDTLWFKIFNPKELKRFHKGHTKFIIEVKL